MRIFKTYEEAKWTKDLLEVANIESRITEDGFYKLKLKDLGMQSRFRLIITQEDIPKAAEFLAKKLRSTIK